MLVVIIAILSKVTLNLFTTMTFEGITILVEVNMVTVDSMFTCYGLSFFINIIPILTDLDITISYEGSASSIIIFVVRCKVSLNLDACSIVKIILYTINNGSTLDSFVVGSDVVALITYCYQTISDKVSIVDVMEIIIVIKATFDLLTILVEVDLSAINNFTTFYKSSVATNIVPISFYIDVMVSTKIF